MATNNEQMAFDALMEQAEATKRDIEGDFPDIDASYDLYVEQLGVTLVGVIDMGDAYCECFEWHGGQWEMMARMNPHEVLERILRKRGAL
jgi:hypothetical protein